MKGREGERRGEERRRGRLFTSLTVGTKGYRRGNGNPEKVMLAVARHLLSGLV